MCGFAAMVAMGGRAPDADVVARMTGALAHRGPDEIGSHVADNVALGFRRLSILDLSADGNQPMLSRDGDVAIVFNGEIFNYVELRRELTQLGHTFNSSGDTEVLLAAYLQWGTDCLRRLNGMWAFLIHDCRSGTLFGSRDRFGIKPLFFVETQEHLLFASEIKAFPASRVYKPDVNWRLAADYLLRDNLSVPDVNNETLYEGVLEVPAATAFEIRRDGSRREWVYWQPVSDEPLAINDAVQEFAELFADSVSLRMRSDVPVGVCLSGGLDSTAIICHMANDLDPAELQDGRALQAFSYTAAEFDEMPQINATVAQTHAELHRLSLSPEDLWDRLKEVAWFHDEPFHSMNVVISYELYRIAANNGVKVILNGQGADEVLGGYPSYFRDYWYSLLRRGAIMECWREVNRHASVHGANGASVFRGAVRHFLQSQLGRFGIYRQMSSRRRTQQLRGSDWFSQDFTRHLDDEIDRYREPTLQNVLADSVGKSPLPLYLRVEDRNSMAHSIESRLPFLDHRLVEFAFRLSDDMKMRGPWNKYVLRQSMKGRIPDVVVDRVDKMGFPVPAAQWFGNSLFGRLEEFLSSRTVAERGIYNTERILRDVRDHRDGKVDISNKVFRVVQFELMSDLIAGSGTSSQGGALARKLHA